MRLYLHNYEVYEGFQTKQQTVAVAVDLEDAYNRVQFNLPMDLLLQYGVSLTLIRWIAGALLEIRNCTVVMQLGNWNSAPHQLTMELPHSSPLSPVLFSVSSKAWQCNNNRTVYPSGITTPDFSAIQTIKMLDTNTVVHFRQQSSWQTSVSRHS